MCRSCQWCGDAMVSDSLHVRITEFVDEHLFDIEMTICAHCFTANEEFDTLLLVTNSASVANVEIVYELYRGDAPAVAADYTLMGL